MNLVKKIFNGSKGYQVVGLRLDCWWYTDISVSMFTKSLSLIRDLHVDAGITVRLRKF